MTALFKASIPGAGALAGPSFNSDPHAIPGVSNLQAIIGYTAWAATALCLVGLIAAGAAMAVSYHRGSNETWAASAVSPPAA